MTNGHAGWSGVVRPSHRGTQEEPLPLGSPLIHPLPVTRFTGAQQWEVCDLLRNRLTRTRQVFFTPVTIEGVWLEGQDDDFTLVVALTQKDRPEVHYNLLTQLSAWDLAEAGFQRPVSRVGPYGSKRPSLRP